MYFGTKSYLKSNRNHTAKQTRRSRNAQWRVNLISILDDSLRFTNVIV
jgi:hypothetical protein